MPPRKVLRAHLLGITFAIFAAILLAFLLVMGKPLLSGFAALQWYILPLVVIVFALGSLTGGVFVIVAVLVAILFSPAAVAATGWALVVLIAEWYTWGYLFGAIFATLYNDQVFLHLITVRRDLIKIAFAFDTCKKVNIIKSPIADEISVPVDPDRRLYDYELVHPPAHPYTLAFIANPYVMQRDNSLKRDPIIKNIDLFLGSVDRALFSLETDEVLGRPEIWSRVRVVVIFDPNLANRREERFSMLQASREMLSIDDVVAENLLDPREEMNDIYRNIMNSDDIQARVSDNIRQKILDETDVIFGLSASPDFDRSTAHYTDWVESVQQDRDPGRAGVDFTFDPNPDDVKDEEIDNANCNDDVRFTCKHEYYADFYGRVALNALGASSKTFIHEFGHAMSSAFHGAIVDEYADTFEVENVESESTDLQPTPFYVNRMDRKKPDTEPEKLIPVHRIFAKYNGNIYYSDLYHPSAEENWIGYFPERETLFSGCTMDRNYGVYQFDKLLSAFMYDRLVAKINRPAKTP
jgi:hypothetical protein